MAKQKISRALIANGAPLHTNNNDYLLINTIIEHNAIQFFKVLMSHTNINVNIPDRKGNFPLHQVAMLSDQNFQNNGINYLPSLLQHNANIHALNHQGQTALHLAISHKNLLTAAHLVLHGCDLEIRDQDGRTARDLLTETSGVGYYVGLRRLVNFQEFIHIADYGYGKVVKAYSKTHSLSIPNDITHLEPNALKSASSLQCLFFPETLVSVGDNACKACNSLALLVIPDHLLPYIQENSTRIGIPANTNVLIYTQWKTRLSEALGTNPRLSRQPLLDIHRMTVRIREHGVDFDATGISLRFLTQFLHKPVSELFNRFPHTLSHQGPIHDTPFYKKLFEVARFINSSPTLSSWSENQHLHVIHVLQLMQTAKPPWTKAKTITSSQNNLFHRPPDEPNQSFTPVG